MISRIIINPIITMKTIYILLIITITCVSCQRQQVENIKFKKLAIDFDKHNAQSLDLINSIITSI